MVSKVALLKEKNFKVEEKLQEKEKLISYKDWM